MPGWARGAEQWKLAPENLAIRHRSKQSIAEAGGSDGLIKMSRVEGGYNRLLEISISLGWCGLKKRGIEANIAGIIPI